MKIYIQALAHKMTPEEIKKMIPEEKLEEVKGKGILQAYSLAHEGTSKPKVLGEGSQILKWPRATIKALREKIKNGLKFFVGHGTTNSNENRKSVGEVVGSFLREIEGKLYNIIVGHFPNQEEVADMDICSMEADVRTDDENIVGDVDEVSGIALGNSSKDSPAFPGALRLSVVQCFGDSIEKEKKGEKPMTYDDVKKAIREMNIHPWQLFTVDDLRNDREFSKIFLENQTLKSEKEKLEKEKQDLEKTNKDAVRKSQIQEASGRLEKMMETGFTIKQREFIKKRFNPESFEELTDEKIKEFLENGKKEYAETAKLFGVSSEGAIEKEEKGSKESQEEKSVEDEALEIIGVK